MSPRTVLYLTPSSRLLGARRSLLQLVTHLDPARYQPIVVAQKPGDLVDELWRAGVPVHLLFMGWWRKAIYWPLFPLRIAQLVRLARRENAALIHCNEFHSNPFAVLAAPWVARKVKTPVPVVTHMRLSITPRQVKTYMLHRASRILTVSQAAAQDFDVWPDRTDRVEVVYNGVDLGEFSPSITRAEARAKLGLRQEDFVIGQFALLSPRKQQHLLIQAAATLKSVLPNLRVLIVGSAGRTEHDYEYELKASATALGLDDIVHFIPFTPRVVELYRACDANILVSNDEGFGRTIIEAGAMDIPTIGTRIGGIPELIRDGETGLLIPGDDTGAALAESIRTLALNPALCHQLGQATRAEVETRFSIKSHADQIMDIYDRLLER